MVREPIHTIQWPVKLMRKEMKLQKILTRVNGRIILNTVLENKHIPESVLTTDIGKMERGMEKVL